MTIRVVAKHAHTPTADDIYVGRGSPLGNPFSHKKGTQAAFVVESRAAAIEHYREWLQHRIAEREPTVMRALAAIYDRARYGNVNLVCYCAPLSCHGDVVAEVVSAHL